MLIKEVCSPRDRVKYHILTTDDDDDNIIWQSLFYVHFNNLLRIVLFSGMRGSGLLGICYKSIECKQVIRLQITMLNWCIIGSVLSPTNILRYSVLA